MNEVSSFHQGLNQLFYRSFLFLKDLSLVMEIIMESEYLMSMIRSFLAHPIQFVTSSFRISFFLKTPFIRAFFCALFI